MSFLDLGPALKEYTARALFDRFQLIQTALNNLTKQNFPKGVEGTILKSHTTPMSALAWLESPIDLVLPATVFQTTSTTPVNVGGYFGWDPAKFPGGTWYLEASIAVADVSATTTVTLKGSTAVGTVTTQATSLTRVRSAALTMPGTAQNLWVQVQTNNATYAASFWGARLINVP